MRSMKIEEYLSKSAFFKLDELHARLMSLLEGELAKAECNLTEALILLGVYFEKDERVTPSMLWASLRTTRSNISHHVTKLERRGLLKRETAAQDARKYPLALSPKGRVLATRLIRTFEAFEEKADRQCAGVA
jgi:DNA-binding MarR family transcriptional regulator